MSSIEVEQSIVESSGGGAIVILQSKCTLTRNESRLVVDKKATTCVLAMAMRYGSLKRLASGNGNSKSNGDRPCPHDNTTKQW